MRVVDMHCDTISELYHKKEKGLAETLRQNTGHLDLQKMQAGHYLLQNFALFVELKNCGGDPWKRVQEYIKLYQEEMAVNADCIAPVLTFGDIAENERNGKMSAMLTVEEGGVCEGDIQKLCTLYHQGVRMLTLTWNYPNGLGYPNIDKCRRKLLFTGQLPVDTAKKAYLNTPDTVNGLTQTGILFVEEMERLGMIVDVSHLSDAGFYDVLTYTKKPFVASHSNARSICPCVRNLTDDMIRSLAERGGVMGLNYCADFLTQMSAGTENPGTIMAIVEHAKHIVNVGGMECIGLGSDFDGIDTHAELPGADKMERLWDALHRAGFTQGQLDKVFAENVLRIYKEVLDNK